jgi:TPR repeat protein
MQKTVLTAGFLLICMIGSVVAQDPSIRKRAWEGDSVAMLELSEAFTFGRGVEKKPDSAMFYLKKSANKGHPDAQFLMGTELLVNVFSAPNYAKGVALLKKAADKGHVDAQYRLSEVYRSKGRGNVSDTYYDPKKAYQYGEMAAIQGLPEALMYCAEARLTGNGAPVNDSLACAFFKRAADEKGYVPALIRMGDMHFQGKATGRVEPFIAVEWYERALDMPQANIDQRGLSHAGIHRVDQFFKKIQNTYLDANPAIPMGMFFYRMR